jgi:hypothetical protein
MGYQANNQRAQAQERRETTRRMPPSPPGSRNGWWEENCPKHGLQQRLSAIGGRCVKCQAEGLSVRAAGG